MKLTNDTNRKRVVLLSRDGLYSRLFVREFLASAELDVVGIVYSTSYLSRGATPIVDIFRFLAKVGLFYAMYQAYIAWFLPWCKGFSRGVNCPILKSNNINSELTVAWLRELKPDFLLSCHFNQKMFQSVIDVPNFAALNFHPSYLPAWRGVDPVLFALQEKCSNLGGSIHRVTAEIDEGDVLLREKLGNEHVAGLIKTNEVLFTLGGRMAAEVLNDFDSFDGRRLSQAALEAVVGSQARYDGWYNVGQLGLVGLWKALWAKPPKV